jgi:cytochrome c oxidase subunit IV
MTPHASTTEVFQIHQDESAAMVKRIWKCFWLLLVITIVELSIGLSIYMIHKGDVPKPMLVLMFKGMVCILSLAKAFYIVSIFMHLGDEIRNMIMTIIVPLMLFIWFITAFLWDGDSWRVLRKTDAGSRPNIEKVEKTSIPAKEEGKKD